MKRLALVVCGLVFACGGELPESGKTSTDDADSIATGASRQASTDLVTGWQFEHAVVDTRSPTRGVAAPSTTTLARTTSVRVDQGTQTLDPGKAGSGYPRLDYQLQFKAMCVEYFGQVTLDPRFQHYAEIVGNRCRCKPGHEAVETLKETPAGTVRKLGCMPSIATLKAIYDAEGTVGVCVADRKTATAVYGPMETYIHFDFPGDHRSPRSIRCRCTAGRLQFRMSEQIPGGAPILPYQTCRIARP